MVNTGPSFLQTLTIFISFLTLAYIVFSYGKLDVVLRNRIKFMEPPERLHPNKLGEFDSSATLKSLEFFSSYHVKGFLRLPHSNLHEPIEVWYNREKRRSRIDYYNGEVKTFQDGNLRLRLRIIPKYDSVRKKHTMGCWRKIDKNPGKGHEQSVIPTQWSWPFKATLESFKYLGEEKIGYKLCSKWQFSHKLYQKDNVYTFWVEKTDPPIPVRYEMIGYDTLLTSYYDKYVIDYTSYEKWEYDNEIFKIPQLASESWCWNVSQYNDQGDGGEFVMNPIGAFASAPHEGDPMDSEFDRYKRHHDKTYSKKEHEERKHLFKHNARFIHSVNRRNLNFKLKLNAFADMSSGEYEQHKGALPDDHEELHRSKRSNRKFIHESYKPRKHSPKIPDELDWRKFGAVSNPRGQGTCGSCWAFAAVGAMEGANFLKTGKLVELSEQQMIDCTWKVKGLRGNFGNNGCHGGWAWRAFFWARRNPIATLGSYGPYRGQESYCKTENLTIGAKIYGFRRVKRYNPTALRKAIAYHGPAAASINSHPMTLKFYSSGILDDESCSNATDHAVLVVGYGRENGINYWLVKNSWSTMWGNGGFIKIKEDLCGVIKKPVVVYDKHLKPYPWHGRTRKPNKHRKHRRRKHRSSRRKKRKK